MPSSDVAAASTADGLPVAPSLGPTIQDAQLPRLDATVDSRLLFIAGLAILTAAIVACVAQGLIALINFITNVSFYGQFTFAAASPADNHLGWLVIVVPIGGAIVVGIMARYGSKAIRGHGIPEAMEQVLTNQSRIPPRLTFLKPLSAAIAIGTGGPFGAEGPIIATGGALGSLFGQLLRTTAFERKVLLAAGAAAGMAATFGAPVSAVLLAIELLLFEYRPRSLIPVALASATAAGIRVMFVGTDPMFAMPNLSTPSGSALALYMLVGALTGLAAIAATRAVYAIEDAFEHLPIHWMWWPAVGAVAVGVCGYFAPRTLGVGYSNISDILTSKLTLNAVLFLCAMKFVSWSISLGSGTSGGTLAPLFTVGGGCGMALGALFNAVFPSAGIDVRIAALVGMAAIFAGASRSLLASVVFAFETTLQPLGLLPLLGGCTCSYLVSSLMMRHTIMTEKIARRGVHVPFEYTADVLEQVTVSAVMSRTVVSLNAEDTVAQACAWLSSNAAGTSHQGFPVLTASGLLAGVITRKDLSGATAPETCKLIDAIHRPPIVVYADCSLRAATDHMLNHNIGRLPVILRDDPKKLVGMITRSDVLGAHRQRIAEHDDAETHIQLLGARELSANGKHPVG